MSTICYLCAYKQTLFIRYNRFTKHREMFKKNKDKMYKSTSDHIQLCCKVLRYMYVIVVIIGNENNI